jgi:asparagine synthase (glutamine-hydrolysing)
LRLAQKRRCKAGVAASAIRPEFARRLRLVDRWVEESAVQPSGRCPSFRRCQVILPTIAKTSALFAEMGAAAGLDIRDPTGDARLLALCLSIPDRIFIEPGTGLDRWVIREAMKGRLPDEVRLNRRRGMQAADVTARLRAAPGEMEDALSAIERGPAADYVDAARLRQVWEQVRDVRTGDTRETRILTSTVLMRGVMAGLFVDGFAARFH